MPAARPVSVAESVTVFTSLLSDDMTACVYIFFVFKIYFFLIFFFISFHEYEIEFLVLKLGEPGLYVCLFLPCFSFIFHQ